MSVTILSTTNATHQRSIEFPPPTIICPALPLGAAELPGRLEGPHALLALYVAEGLN